MTGPPQTPRSSGQKASITPSFSFGLGFLPSFQFSPSRLISPQRFFQVGSVGSTLAKAVGPRESSLNAASDVFDERQKDHNHANTSSSVNDSLNDSLWSMNSAQQVSGVTSIYEEESDSKPYLTPSKLVVLKSPVRQSGVTSGPNNPFDVAEEPSKAAIGTPANDSRSQLEQLASAKRRRISKVLFQGSDDSTEEENGPGGQDAAEKVWTDELDRVLYLAYLKYKEFKQANAGSPGLRNASQNNIISAMILNKTGSKRSPKQIASRLHRLLRQIKPAFDSLPEVEIPHSVASSDANDISPRTAESHNINEDISSLLVSSPFSDANGINGYAVTPSELTIAYINKNDSSKSLHFTKLLSTTTKTIHLNQLRETLSQPVNNLLSDPLMARVISKNTSLSHIKHCINITSGGTSPHSASSPIGSLSTDDGYFKANIKLCVEANHPPQGVLNWKCHTLIFKQGHIILKYNEDVNAYPSGRNFELPIPFLKQFWSGYLTYMQNGGYDEASMNELSIVQLIYSGDGDFDALKSTVYGILAHDFTIQLNSDGCSTVDAINLTGEVKNQGDAPKKLSASAPPPLTINAHDSTSNAPIYNASVVSNLNQEMIRRQEQIKKGESPAGQSISICSPFSAQPTPRHFSTSTPAKDLPVVYKQAMTLQAPVMQQMPYSHFVVANEDGIKDQAYQFYQQAAPPMNQFQAVQQPMMPQMVAVNQESQMQQMQQQLINQQRLMMQYQSHYPPALQPTITVPNSAPASQMYFFQGSERPLTAKAVKSPVVNQAQLTNHETNKPKPMEITFGPILEYDPSKGIPKKQRLASTSSINKIGMGVHRYAQVSMYQPNKKK